MYEALQKNTPEYQKTAASLAIHRDIKVLHSLFKL